MAALTTVMVLVLVMSITFAFANRSLIFEQRTSANQMRSTQALEVAEAGIEWAVALLGTTSALNSTCVTGTGATNSYFERYLSVDASTGNIIPSAVQSGCTVDPGNGALSCSCPTSGSPTLSGTGGRFTVQFSAIASRPSVVQITSTGSSNESSDGIATVSLVLMQVRAANPSPKAALTAGRNVNWQGAGSSLYVANTDPDTNGISINAGGTVNVDANVNLMSVPGTPQGSDTGLSVVANDSSLGSMSGDEIFSSMMGTTKSDYYSSDKTNVYSSVSGLSDTAVNSAENPLFWIGPAPGAGSNTGSFDLPTGTYGDPDNPVVLVFNGSVRMSGNTTIYGVLYSTADTQDNLGGGNSLIRGAAVAEGNYSKGNGSREVIFDPDILAILQAGTKLSSFKKLPGSWLD